MTECKEKKAPNWVANQAGCTIEGAFEELMKRVRYDVDQANLRPSVTKGRKFNTDSSKEWSLKVYAFNGSPSNHEKGRILFFKNSKTIAFQKGENGDTVHIIPRWCDEKNKCDYMIENEPFEIWEISKMALCELFFGED